MCLYLETMQLIIMKKKMKMKNRSHRCDINRPCSRNKHKYSKYEKYLTMTMLCILSNIKQHLKLNSLKSSATL